MALAGILFNFMALVQLAAPGGGPASLRIGMPAPDGLAQAIEERIGWYYCASAASFAIDDLKRNGIIPASTDIQLIWRNDMNLENMGIWKVIELMEVEQCDVIMGAPSSASVRAAAFYTGYRNHPHMCWVCSNSELASKTTFPTLVRTFADFGSIGSALKKVFIAYGWKRTSYWMNDDFEVCRNSKQTIITNFATVNITIAEQISFSTQVYSLEFLQQSLRRLQNQARVIIICGFDYNVRDFVMEAARMGMSSKTGYLFWLMNQALDMGSYRGWILSDGKNAEAKSAWTSVLELLVDVSTPVEQQLRDVMPMRMTQPPYNNSKALNLGKRGCVYGPYLYDSIYLYGRFVNWSIESNSSYRDGKAFINYFRNKRFQGMTGDIIFNNNGDRESAFTIYQIDPANDNYSVLMAINPLASVAINESFRFFNPPRWYTPDGTVPKDTPLCGFWNEFCPDMGTQDSSTNKIIIIVSLTAMALFGAVIAGLIYRQRKQAMALLQSTWQVAADDLRFLKNAPSSSLHSMKSANSAFNRDERVATVASGLVVFAKQFPMRSAWNGSLLQPDIIMLNTMRQLNHENVNQFVGVCCLPDNLCLLYAFGNKGSLMDILANESITIDADFQASFLLDIIEGMVFLHNSQLRCLGNLKSPNCLVDNRWIVKITDYGIDRAKRMFGVDGRSAEVSEGWYQGLFWTAPECLLAPPSGVAALSPKGDIYSFAMIMYEILFRIMPYESDDKLSPEDIINHVRDREQPPFRPSMEPDSAVSPNHVTALRTAHPELVKLIQTCWSDDPAARPEASSLRNTLRSTLSTFRRNIIDSVLQKLEKYAANLEHIVDDRTQQLMDEKKRTEQLLYRMMPQTVAEQLKSGLPVLPETYDDVTVYFSDIVGFTSLSAQSTPMQVVQLLNDLYTMFDDIIGQHDVYKVETIGDAYMVASGLPVRKGRRHACNIADMALDLLSAVLSFRVAHRPEEQLQLRQGIHTGPVVAGVVGTIMPRYCLFGDTVNNASRMESSGMGLHIQCSATTHAALEPLGLHLMQHRGEIQVKGKGVQSTYWLYGRDGYTKPLPGLRVDAPAEEH